MANSRLTQIGVGGRAYETPTDVDVTTQNWGWTAYPVTVDYAQTAVSRLSQMGIGVAAYPVESGVVIGPITADWGWQPFDVTVDYQDPLDVETQTDNWGWTAESVVICSQDPRGYFGSFSGNVWPSCTFNDHVFGPRTHVQIEAGEQFWGWQPQAVEVVYSDPVDVDIELGNWGWRGHAVAVSIGTEIQLTLSPWGWQPFPVTIEVPQDIEASFANWGWRPHPVSVSYGTEIGINIATWGWQAFPVSVDVPVYDIAMRKADWGWQSFPVGVQQISLLPSDIEAIAEAVYQKFVDEGVIQQVLETWQRQGCDSSYPQDIPPAPGKYIEVGGMRIYVERMPDGRIRHTRQ